MGGFMSRKAILLALVIICLPSFSLADIGRIKRTYGEAYIERAGKRITAEAGMLLKRKDILVTGGDGRITVSFIDNSRFSTGADARISLDRFDFNETTYEGRFELSVEKGTIAIVSGRISSNNPDDMRVKTPTSVLGVRGTRFIVQVKPTLVVLPNEEDEEKDSALAILGRDGEPKVVTEEYALTKLGSKSDHDTKTSFDDVRAEHGPMLDDMPPPPKTYTLLFETNEATVAEKSEEVLKRMLEDASTREQADVQIIGHTDAEGPTLFNDRLSLRRANGLKEQLIKLGVKPDRIRTSGRGERELAIETGPNEEKAENRRAEVVVR